MVRKQRKISTTRGGPTTFGLPFGALLKLLHTAQESEPPEECHTEIQTRLDEEKGKIVCVGKCPKEKKCHQFEQAFGKKRKLVACVCDDDEFGDRCNLIVITKDGDIEGSFCFGACPKDKRCERGVKLDRENKTLRIFCFCK